jgi:subtilisin family serine protease
MTVRQAILWLLAALLAIASASAVPAATAVVVPPERQILVMVQQAPGVEDGYGGGGGDRDRLARKIARAHGLAVVDTWPMSRIGLDCFVMAVPTGHSTATAADEVSRDPNVQWAEPVALYEAQSAPVTHNDPLFAAQPAARQWHLAQLHETATGKGVKVAVIDSGIEGNHPDLAGQLTVNRNFVASRPPAFEQHGTGVAGIIAAKADNKVGISGIAPGAKLLGLRACWQANVTRTVCDSFSVIKALYYAIDQKADVINMSISGPGDRLLRTLVDLALERGSSVVAAFDQRRPDGGFPASLLGVIAVSDSPIPAARGHVFVAPGRDIPTTQPGDRWFLVSGSSFAAAHVSGLLALLREKGHSMSLVTAAAGRIDACASLDRAAGDCECACDRAGMTNAHR